MELVIQIYRYKINDSDSEELIRKKFQRQLEIDECLKKNLTHKNINNFHIFMENDNELYFKNIIGDKIDRCNIIFCKKQPTYKDFIEYISNNIKYGNIVCIMNSDIYLDKDLDFNYIYRYIYNKQAFVICRHEITDVDHSICNYKTCQVIYNFGGSADIFIFSVNEDIKRINLKNINFKQNIFGADVIFTKELRNVGYILKNPCFQIKGFHNHKDSVYFDNYENITNDDIASSVIEPPSILPVFQCDLLNFRQRNTGLKLIIYLDYSFISDNIHNKILYNLENNKIKYIYIIYSSDNIHIKEYLLHINRHFSHKLKYIDINSIKEYAELFLDSIFCFNNILLDYYNIVHDEYDIFNELKKIDFTILKLNNLFFFISNNIQTIENILNKIIKQDQLVITNNT